MILFKRVLVLLYAVSWSPCHAFVATSVTSSSTRRRCGRSRRPPASLYVALTPIGPFCPFRSSAAVAIEPRIEELNEVDPELATEMAKIQLAIQLGNDPDKDRLFRVADGIDKAVARWENLFSRLKMSGDFQSREYEKLTQVHLANSGVTPKSVTSIMRWQGGCMRAMALNAPPPMPPGDLDLQQLMSSSSSDKPPPSMTRMSAAVQITSNPFDKSALQTALIRNEYKRLCSDHMNLIELGARYSTFDPTGKVAYIDEMERIENRWDDFFSRFSLTGVLNSDFSRQCEAFLMSMNLNAEECRMLLKRAHESMRCDAEEERNNLSF